MGEAAIMGRAASERHRRIDVMREVSPKLVNCGDYLKSRLPLASFCIVVVLLSSALGQTYEVDKPGGTSTPSGQKQKPSTTDTTQGNTIGWGSSIDVARQERAGDAALKRNDYAAAMTYAEHAAKSAPQDAELWFLLGYAARLNERYQVSVDAYSRGLQLKPNSVGGMAGLAHTY